MKSHLSFNRQQRSGIFFLLLLIIILQFGYFGLKYFPSSPNENSFQLDIEKQKFIDSLKQASDNLKNFSIKPFNPNYISDYKGYTLGLSPLEMDKLHQFRANNRFVNSKEEFQQVTGVSDSLLGIIAPLFKFPDWTKSAEKTKETVQLTGTRVKIKDLNTASADDLRRISGIGDKLSARIVKFREGLGGFLVNEQLYDVYGLEPDVVKRTLSRFQVLNPPTVDKIDINSATVDELAELIYLRYNVAKNIVVYREENGPFESLEELFNVSGFPVNKIDRIELYLSY